MNFDWFNMLAIPLAIYGAFWVLEIILPKSKPALKVDGWWTQVSALVALRLAVSFAAIPLLSAFASTAPKGGLLVHYWPEAGALTVTAMVLVTYTFLHYWSHRMRHKFEWLWRATHQMHHSPNRFDLSLAVFVHPFDVLFILAVMFFSVQLVCGFAPEQIGLAAFLHYVLDKPMHMNVKTPRWTGYFLFRPEQHSLHHETHDNNFGLIPLWDLIFGTFKDCADQAEQIGFPNLKPASFWQILLCKKVG